MPQWNCACANCRQARLGVIPKRTQSSVAIGDDDGNWFLVNASPDLPAQIEAFPKLRPAKHPARNSPLSTVLLTNADLDHALGLFSLREGNRLEVYATKATQRSLTHGIGLNNVLQTFCGAVWRVPSKKFFPLMPNGGLRCRAIALPGKSPRFDKKAPASGHSVAYQFFDVRTGGRVLIAPDVAEINEPLQEALENSQAVIFDGTFWSADELADVKRGAPKAAQMGHVTIKDVSLSVLSKLSARHKIYIHINNTNPILARRSAERSAVEAAGIVVGYDGLNFKI